MTIIVAAAEVLKCFSAERQELNLTDIVAMRGAPKSSTSRLLRAMRDAGFLENVGSSKRYRPSLLLFQLGQLYRSGSSLMARAEAVLSDLVEQVGHTGYISIREGGEVFGLRSFAGRHVLRVGTPVGRKLIAPATATGRSLLARLPDDTIRDMFAGGWPIPSATAPQNMDELLARIHEVRRTGLSEFERRVQSRRWRARNRRRRPPDGGDHQHVRHLSRRDHHAGRARDHRRWPAGRCAIHRHGAGRQAMSLAAASPSRFTTEVADHARGRALAHRIRYRRHLHRFHPL